MFILRFLNITHIFNFKTQKKGIFPENLIPKTTPQAPNKSTALLLQRMYFTIKSGNRWAKFPLPTTAEFLPANYTGILSSPRQFL